MKPVLEPNCQNIFCGNCILKWLESKPSCPLCREQVKINELIYIDDGTPLVENKPHFDIKDVQTKVNTIISLLKSKQDGKFIIFSDWNETFVPIRRCLTDNSIDFIEVKGHSKTRQQNIESFKYGKVNVIFLNSKFNGSGINLQEASDIIIYHEMETSILNQIIGRANRIGRTSSLDVHHLVL